MKDQTFYAWVRSFKKRPLPPRVRPFASDWIEDAKGDPLLPKGSDLGKIIEYMDGVHGGVCDEARVAAIAAWVIWWNEQHRDRNWSLEFKEMPEDEEPYNPDGDEESPT